MPDQPPIPPAQRRAAEERLRARYEADLTAVMTIPPERADFQPIWPLGEGRMRWSEASMGCFVETVELEGAYPDTMICITFRFHLRLECRFAGKWALWNLKSLNAPEPLYDDMFWVHLQEWVAKDFDYRRHQCAPGETVVLPGPTPWTRAIPRIVSGEFDVDPYHRELAVRAMEHLNLTQP